MTEKKIDSSSTVFQKKKKGGPEQRDHISRNSRKKIVLKTKGIITMDFYCVRGGGKRGGEKRGGCMQYTVRRDERGKDCHPSGSKVCVGGKELMPLFLLWLVGKRLKRTKRGKEKGRQGGYKRRFDCKGLKDGHLETWVPEKVHLKSDAENV